MAESQETRDLRMEHLYNDIRRAMNTRRFDVAARLSVQLAGEFADDEGIRAMSYPICVGCDGYAEIPDPKQPNTAVYFGLVIEALPEAGAAPEAEYAPFSSVTVADLRVDFFDEPDVLRVAGACGQVIGLTGYGGSGEDSGLSFYAWTGSELRLLLSTNGFLVGDPFYELNDGFTFTTQRLTYDESQGICFQTQSSFTWANNAFTQTGEGTAEQTDCFNESTP